MRAVRGNEVNVFTHKLITDVKRSFHPGRAAFHDYVELIQHLSRIVCYFINKEGPINAFANKSSEIVELGGAHDREGDLSYAKSLY